MPYLNLVMRRPLREMARVRIEGCSRESGFSGVETDLVVAVEELSCTRKIFLSI